MKFAAATNLAVESGEKPTPSSTGAEFGKQVAELAPGQKAGGGRYTLIKFLGKGGMGIVWLARDEHLRDDVALKFLPANIHHDVEALDDMRRETLKSRKLSHPNIIRIHDLHVSPDESPFISMEYIAGAPLNTLKAQQPQRFFTWEYLKPVIKQLCDALDYAHKQKVIHRDLKPANMMLTTDGVLKLADFGIAAVVSDSMSRVSLKHSTSGTVVYMSPQQMNGQRPTPSDDIYALGATMYELLTSKPPFYSGDILHQVQNIEPQPLTERLADLGLANEIPPDVSAMVMACLSKDPPQRPPSAGAVAEWIGLQNGTQSSKLASAKPEPVLADEDLESVPVLLEDSEAGKVAMAGKGKAGLWIGVGVAVLVLLGIGGFLLLGNKDKSAAKDQTSSTGANSTATPTASPPPTTSLAVPAAAPSTTVTGTGPNQLDTSLNPLVFSSGVFKVETLPDSKVLAAGSFTNINGITRSRLVRLLPDGSIDVDFDTKANISAPGYIRTFARQTDGKLIVGREKSLNPKAWELIRLNTNGTPDRTFLTNARTWDNEIRAIIFQNDGRILVGGFFAARAGSASVGSCLQRLNRDGSLDLTYDAVIHVGLGVMAFNKQADGKILMGGQFSAVVVAGKDIPRKRIARLNADGTLDATFDPGQGADEWVAAIEPQKDGTILIGGKFTSFGGHPRRLVARLNSKGQVDLSFKPEVPQDWSYVGAIFRQRDGRILLGGTKTNGDCLPNVVRLLADGRRDSSFNITPQPRGGIYSFAPAQDGRVWVGGVNGFDTGGANLFRLLGDSAEVKPATKAPPSAASTTNEPGFVPLFNLLRQQDWYQSSKRWTIDNGVLTCRNPLPNGTERASWTKTSLSDFEVRFSYRTTGTNADDAVPRFDYREKSGTPSAPAADMQRKPEFDGSSRYFANLRSQGAMVGTRLGAIFENTRLLAAPGQKVTARRTGNLDVEEVTATLATPEQVVELVRDREWNEVSILAQGNRLVHSVNGMVVAELLDENAQKRRLSGGLSFSVSNVGKSAFTTEFKNIRIKQLP